LGSAAALAAALLGFALAPAGIWTLGILLTVMFTVFNLLEAVLPSLVSKAAGAGAKGTAMGVFASAQFTGAFLGGLLGGLAHERFGPEAVYLVGAGAALAWLAVAATLRPPGQLMTHLLPLGPLPAAALPTLRERLLAVPGVEEAVIAVDEGVAHLKVDNRRVDWARLTAAAAEV
jgi:MFS family permease